MPTVNQQEYNPNFSRELDIEAIISAPLVAASKANVVMVTGQTRFLLEYCFSKTGDGLYQPVMIPMQMTRGVINPGKKPGDPDYITKAELVFTVPLLCLVPINSLVIDKVALDFDLEITSVTASDTKATNNTGKTINDNKAQLNGKVSYDPREYSANPKANQNRPQLSSKLKVSINAGPLPLPSGVLTILDLYNKAIQPLPGNSDKPSDYLPDNV